MKFWKHVWSALCDKQTECQMHKSKPTRTLKSWTASNTKDHIIIINYHCWTTTCQLFLAKTFSYQDKNDQNRKFSNSWLLHTVGLWGLWNWQLTSIIPCSKLELKLTSGTLNVQRLLKTVTSLDSYNRDKCLQLEFRYKKNWPCW